MNQENFIPKTQQLSISLENLKSIQVLLRTLDFDLYEIWTLEDGSNYEIWKAGSMSIRIDVCLEKKELCTHQSDIVNELDYLFWELRAIRGTLEDHVYGPEIEDIEKPTSPLDDFEDLASCLDGSLDFNSKEKNFLFKKYVDPQVLAYLSLNQDDRKRIQH